jgi:predicted RNA-binding Zn ribbon-like protein
MTEERGDDVTHVPLIGGHISLDFANTAGSRTREGREERLHRYDDLLRWAKRLGTTPSAQIVALHTAERAHPTSAGRALVHALEFREALYRIFSATVANRAVQDSDLVILNAVLHDALAHRALARTGLITDWKWSNGSVDLARPLWAIALAAAELLTGPEVARVRECANTPCSWLFLDRSRNHSRRWCEMRDCGNRVKGRAFAARQRRTAARRT